MFGGPASVQSSSGCRLHLSIVDDNTKYIWLFLLHLSFFFCKSVLPSSPTSSSSGISSHFNLSLIFISFVTNLCISLLLSSILFIFFPSISSQLWAYPCPPLSLFSSSFSILNLCLRKHLLFLLFFPHPRSMWPYLFLVFFPKYVCHAFGCVLFSAPKPWALFWFCLVIFLCCEHHFPATIF